MLYLVATPIGNLSDITLRAIDTLKQCDYILCEDTRHSSVLLQHHNIRKPLKSFHKFSESSKQENILSDLRKGFSIALISDAGTPGISDPGEQLVAACISENITVTAIPGPCAAIAALCCSGLDMHRFQFIGFLPKKTQELRRALQEILLYPGTTICYESPHRILEVLEQIDSLAPEHFLVIARELTKKFEEVCRGTAKKLIEYGKNSPMKGEIVLLFEPHSSDDADEWKTLTPQQHVELLETTYGLSRHEAIKMAAQLRGVSKRDIYNIVQR